MCSGTFPKVSFNMDHHPSLITPEQLKPVLGDPNIQVVQVVSQALFASTYIPSAARILPQELVLGQPPAPGELPHVEQLNRLFGRIGLTPETTVVVADDEGGAWAGRVAWTLDMIGHSKWCYLNGGIQAWMNSGGETTNSPTDPEPVELDLEIREEGRIKLEQLVTELDDPNLLIWDCRTREEYLGTRPTAQRNGHIPGAVHLNWVDLVDYENNLQIAANGEQQLSDLGISPDKSLVVHCQTHHRSAFAYMYARLLGFPNVRAYAGSWAEWGNHPSTPIEI